MGTKKQPDTKHAFPVLCNTGMMIVLTGFCLVFVSIIFLVAKTPSFDIPIVELLAKKPNILFFYTLFLSGIFMILPGMWVASAGDKPMEFFNEKWGTQFVMICICWACIVSAMIQFSFFVVMEGVEELESKGRVKEASYVRSELASDAFILGIALAVCFLCLAMVFYYRKELRKEGVAGME